MVLRWPLLIVTRRCNFGTTAVEPLQNFQLEQNEIENTNELVTSPQASHQDEANEQSVQQVNVMVEYPIKRSQLWVIKADRVLEHVVAQDLTHHYLS